MFESHHWAAANPRIRFVPVENPIGAWYDLRLGKVIQNLEGSF